jgi:large subunit ribosomal protein L17
MRKRVFGRNFSRDKGSRNALFRSLIRALILHGKIQTTKAKAKAIQGAVDKLLSIAKKGDVSARRRAYAILANDRGATDKLFNSVAKTFVDVKSGFTRITNLPPRRGDFAQMARIEWTKEVAEEKSKKAKMDKSQSKDSKEKLPKTEKNKVNKIANIIKTKKSKK